MDLGRRQNADPRWILPLLCRRGHITRNEIGAIRIGIHETHFQVPRAIAGRFADAVARTASGSAEDGSEVRIEVAPEEGRGGGDNRPAPRHEPRSGPPQGHGGKPQPATVRPTLKPSTKERPDRPNPHKPRTHRKRG